MTTFQILEQFCEIVQGGRHKLSGNDFVKSGYPAYGAGGMNGYLATFEFDESAVILSSIGARCGKCFYVEGRWSSLTNTQVIFPDKNECDAKFLWYQLNDEKRWPRAGTGQPFIKPSDVKRHKVFLPPIEEQRRIAAILDQAETLRTQRRTALALLDSLTQSLFLDMFGDLVVNPKGWKKTPFGNVCPTRLGKMLDAKQQTGQNTRRYLRNANVQWFHIDVTDLFEMDFDADARETFQLQAGDLLICEGGEPGRAAIWNGELEDVYYQKALHRGRPNPALAKAEFLVWLLWFLAKRGGLGDHVTAATIAHLTGEKLKAMEIPLPPLPLQQTFATRIASIEALKATHRRALAALDALFASLQQRAFAGAL